MKIETPTQEIFDEMKSIASDIWNTYDNSYGYVDEKMERINSFDNIQDNAMVFYRMFDGYNKKTFKDKASQQVLEYIKKYY